MQNTVLQILTALVLLAALCGLAAAVGEPGAEIFGMPALMALAVLAIGLQWLVFLPSWLKQTEHFYDLTGSLTYLLVVWLAVLATDGVAVDARTWLLAAMVTVWALRLGSFLFRRVRRSGKDGRFDEIKQDFGRFLIAWSLQGVWVFMTLLAALIAMTSPQAPGLDFWALIGALIWLTGFAIEVVADAQKSRFTADPANQGRFINVGLWRWSRHPNYFGEILLWIGVCVIALPSFSGWQWLGLLSPAFVAVLIIKISGVPMLEERAEEKWGDDPEYQRYREQTPVLMLRPPKS